MGKAKSTQPRESTCLLRWQVARDSNHTAPGAGEKMQLYLLVLSSFSSVQPSVASSPHPAVPWLSGPGRFAAAADSPGAVPSDPAVWGHAAAQWAVLPVAQAQPV